MNLMANSFPIFIEQVAVDARTEPAIDKMISGRKKRPAYVLTFQVVYF